MDNAQRVIWKLALPALLLTVASSSGWAWRGGFRGPGIGLYVGPGWGGYGYGPYDPYYGYPADPYYSPYDYGPYYPPQYRAVVVPQPYADQNAQQVQQAANEPDDSRHDLKFLESQISRARAQINFEYDDGDVSADEHSAEMHRLSQIRKAARAAAKANGGFITGDQQSAFLAQVHGESATVPEYDSRRSQSLAPVPTMNSIDLKRVNDELTRVRTLNDKKLTDGEITKPQHDGMKSYLDQLNQQVRSDAESSGGKLSPDQEDMILQQLRRANDSLTKNLIMN